MKKLLISSLVVASVFTACNDDAKEQTKHEVTKIEVKSDIKKNETVKVVEKTEVAKVEVKEVHKTAKQLFATCAGCHGADASKKALNKSSIIKGWDASKISTALNGYKDGSYGGSMKGVMKGQVKNLTKEDISTLSEYISKL